MRKCAWGIAALLLVAAVSAAWADSYLPIQLRETTFDPKCALPPEVRAARTSQPALTSTIPGGRNYYIVQFQGPIKQGCKRQAAALGAVFIEYIPRFAYLTRMTPDQASQVAGLSFVRWVGPLAAQWKYPSSLVATPQRSLNMIVKLHPGEIFDRVGQFLRDRGAWYLGFTRKPHPALRVRMVASAVPDLAALPEVAWIQEWREPQLCNDQGQRWLNVSNVGGLPWGVDVWQDYGLFGQSQIVGIADTGLDTGSLATLHNDFRDANGQPRVVRAFALGRPGDWSDSTEPPLAYGSHGTHVAGSVLGNGAMSGSNPASRDYTGSFAGMAPEARVVFQSVMDETGGLGGLPFNFGQLFDQSYREGARIHTNSWGTPWYFGEYTFESFMVDDFMWRHPELTILFAAGNEGFDWDADGVIDPVSVTPPATAKNCISVGAAESYRPPFHGWGGLADYTWGYLWGYPADPIASDYTSDDPSGMAAFSSRGPCVDGRIKPDVVAPGTNIISVRSRGKYGDYRGVDTGWGVYDAYYLYMGGTSMATPLTAGAAALVREYYEVERGYSGPTGSLIKATLIHGARDLAPGQYGTGPDQEIYPRPDPSQGWGEPSIGATLHPEVAHPGTSLVFHDYGMITDTARTDIHPVVVTSSATPLSITLAWTDAPASMYAWSALVNDLDLIVVDPNGNRYRGNYGSQVNYDRVNNVEHLDFPTPVVGTYYVQVYGYNVPEAPQPYSLVMTAPAATTYSISGRVRDQVGQPVSGVAITVEGINTVPGRRVTGSTRSDGTYEIRNLLSGRYRVTPSKPYYEFTPVDRRVDVVNANVTNVNFTASVHVTYQLSGYVWKEMNQPVAGVYINVYQWEPPFQEPIAAYPAVTGSDGRWVVTGLDPGYWYTMEPEPVANYFISPGYREILLPSREANNQHFWLSRLWYSLIDVYTLDPGKNPIANTTVKLERWEGAWQVAQTRQTNAQGFVRLGGQEADGSQILRDGYYRISVSKRGYTFEVTPFVNYVEGWLPPDGPFNGDLLGTIAAFYFWGGSPAPTYAASGLVRTLWDRPVPDVAVTLSGESTGRVFRTRTRSNGYYYQTGMPSDLYRVTVQKAGWTLTPIDPGTGWPDPEYEPLVKVGPPGYAYLPVLAELEPWDVWAYAFLDFRDLAYQYVNGRQDYWAEPQ